MHHSHLISGFCVQKRYFGQYTGKKCCYIHRVRIASSYPKGSFTKKWPPQQGHMTPQPTTPLSTSLLFKTNGVHPSNGHSFALMAIHWLGFILKVSSMHYCLDLVFVLLSRIHDVWCAKCSRCNFTRGGKSRALPPDTYYGKRDNLCGGGHFMAKLTTTNKQLTYAYGLSTARYRSRYQFRTPI